MRKSIILSTVLAIIISFSACKKAPDEVKNEADILDNNHQAQTADLEFLSLDEIRKTSSDTISSNNTNVVVDNIRIGAGNSMPAYKISPYNDNFDKLKPLVEYLYNEQFSVDSPYCEYHKKGDTVSGNITPEAHSWLMYKGKDQDFTRSLIYHETGYSFYNAVSGDDPYRFTEYFPTEKRYKINIGEQLDNKSYTMIDGNEWSVNDAADYAQNFADKYLAPLENNQFTYSITDFRVKKLDSNYGYVIEFQRADKNGNLFDNHYYYANSEINEDRDTGELEKESRLAKDYPYLYSSAIQITLNCKDKINSFVKCNTPYTGKVVDKGEKLISLSSAINIISNEYADKSAYSFETAELEYYYVSLDCPDYTSPEAGNSPSFDAENMLNNADVELRPYWAFTSSECYPDVQNEENTTMVYSNCLYLVDAVTGKLYVI